jgi:hypothetical protein
MDLMNEARPSWSPADTKPRRDAHDRSDGGAGIAGATLSRCINLEVSKVCACRLSAGVALCESHANFQ